MALNELAFSKRALSNGKKMSKPVRIFFLRLLFESALLTGFSNSKIVISLADRITDKHGMRIDCPKPNYKDAAGMCQTGCDT